MSAAGEPTGWQAIQEDVLARIRAREWPPGTMIPTEAELATEYGCARATVNRALRELADAGYLDRRRKAGTRVAALPVRKATFAIPVIRLEVEGRGMAYSHELLSCRREAADGALAARLGLRTGAEVLRIRAMHRADGAPYCYEDRLVPVAAVPGILSADLRTVSANEWLVRNAPFTRGDLEFSAREAGPEEAEVLGCAPGAALFTLDRRTWNGSDAVTEVRISYAPGYSMKSEI
ncbi:GntR family transcriptional regulator [Ostreiculturibacter nitratireducens]|uniref:GntR family transcriptional regulator n=1 Tax=Ostreiculturibacter nitratireducens TaxID=3075226 RepID=UPI0031B5FA1D